VFGHELFERAHHVGEAGNVPALAIGVFVVGTLAALLLYKGRQKDPVRIPLFANRFYMDELYAALIAGTQDMLASVAGWFDRYILDGVIVRGISAATFGVGYAFRLLQFGNLQGYAFLFGAGVVVLLYLLIH
jgi:NADH-quinone oxidoreductase subunit L